MADFEAERAFGFHLLLFYLNIYDWLLDDNNIDFCENEEIQKCEELYKYRKLSMTHRYTNTD